MEAECVNISVAGVSVLLRSQTGNEDFPALSVSPVKAAESAPESGQERLRGGVFFSQVSRETPDSEPAALIRRR